MNSEYQTPPPPIQTLLYAFNDSKCLLRFFIFDVAL